MVQLQKEKKCKGEKEPEKEIKMENTSQKNSREDFEELEEWGREYAEKKGIEKEDVLEGD